MPMLHKIKLLLGFFRTIDQVTTVYRHIVSQLGRKNWPLGSKKPGEALVEMFHGHVDSGSERLVPQSFTLEDSPVRCLVSTIAFGLGVQIPNVRYILHWGPPSSLMGYVQEVGRCSRDGQPGKAVLYVPPHTRNRRFIDEDMIKYIDGRETSCLRYSILMYLRLEEHDEEDIRSRCFDSSRCCSYCDSRDTESADSAPLDDPEVDDLVAKAQSL